MGNNVLNLPRQNFCRGGLNVGREYGIIYGV